MPIKSQVEGSVCVSVSECACVFQQLKCQIKTNVSHHVVSVVVIVLACSWTFGGTERSFQLFRIHLRVLASSSVFKA